MKKIAIVVQRFGKEIMGGAEQHALVLAKKLQECFDVTVLSTCAKDYYTWKNEYKSGVSFVDGIKTIRFKTDFARKKNKFDKLSEQLLNGCADENLEEEWIIQQGPYSADLFTYIEEKDFEYDAFIFVTYLYATTVLGMRKIKKSKIFLVPTAHDEKAIYLDVYNDVFNKPDGIIYNTDAEKSFVEKRFGNESVDNIVAGVGVEFPHGFFAKELNIKKDYFIYLGRIDENKGCRELFDFVQKSDLCNFKAVIAGKKYIKIPKGIRYLGVLSEEEKFWAISNSRFVVIPSRFESLSLVLLESFLLGKPVLVNGMCAVLKEHCLKSNGGLWYHDLASFNEALKWFFDNPEKALELGENGRRYVQKNYNWDLLSVKISEFIFSKTGK